MEQPENIIFTYWGKADPNYPDEPKWHPLVYHSLDVADIYKFETVVPLAFKIAAKHPGNPEQQVRLACRDVFRESKLLERIIPGIEEMLSAGEISPPAAPNDAVQPAIPNPESLGDAGHRA